MNKMIKGAAVAGLGIALLLGGAGTLAVWNDAAQTDAGSIVAGNLDVEAGAGRWTSNLSGAVADISTYRVVPGESLTYSQPLTVTLVGDQLEATLAVTGAAVNNGFTTSNVEVTQPVLTTVDGLALPAILTPATNPGTVKASVTFNFLSTTTGRDSVNATYDFSQVGFILEQKAPVQG